jgi:dGTPase
MAKKNMESKFSAEKTQTGSSKWEHAISREKEMYKKWDDIRNEFSRDYNRILHCNAYRRLKHKTQVFYATRNDHICTRIEHVQHVAAISTTITQELGLNVDLAAAIALGHDLGHAPFGHQGERIISKLTETHLKSAFWHEKNSLIVADKIETLARLDGKKTNLNLTYAVRDGLISHCGEVNENGLIPRTPAIDLYSISKPNEFAPFTWEACVVKIADKIAYLGRDIEDALRLNILNNEQIEELEDTLRLGEKSNIEKINTTNLVHAFILNLIEHSTPETGLAFSDDFFRLMNQIKAYNYKHIYKHPRLLFYNNYAQLIIDSLFNVLIEAYSTIPDFHQLQRFYPNLSKSFISWLSRYSDIDIHEKNRQNYAIPTVYQIDNKDEYVKAVIMYISLMSDQFALEQYHELIAF